MPSADTPISEDDLVWDVEEEHLREAEFLFEVREAVLDADDRRLLTKHIEDVGNTMGVVIKVVRV